MTDLDKLERLLKAATPGPWNAQCDGDGGGRGGGWWSLRFGSEDQAVAWKVCTGQDAALIVALRNAAPELIAEIRSLKETVKAAHRAGFQHDMGPCICAVCK